MLHKCLMAVGLIAAMMTSAYAQQPTTPKVNTKALRICSGGKTGNYFMAANEISRRFGQDLFPDGVTVINTAGSLDNLRRLSLNECDIGFSQSDVVGQYVIENPASRDTLLLLRSVYTEYVHILCPTASGWATLSDFANAKGNRRLIVGPDGSGTAETWRIMRQVNGKLYDGIQRIPDPSDISSAHSVADSTDTCMLWVSGLNSNDMVAANELSVRTFTGKPSLELLSIDDSAILHIKDADGKPLYKLQTVTPHAAHDGVKSLYDHLINNGGWFSSASVDVLTVPAYMMISSDYKQAINRETLARVLQAIDDAQPTIWARVNPAGEN